LIRSASSRRGGHPHANASVSCYWERLNGFGGDLNDIIANDLSVKNPVVAIESTGAGFNCRLLRHLGAAMEGGL
jgi:hypothetical protein